MSIRKPNELIYWELSNGDNWKLTPVGLGMYSITNETMNVKVEGSFTMDAARALVKELNLTITEEL